MAASNNDVYIFSPCAQEAIDELYPASKNELKFMLGQQSLQAALIRCHMPNMNAETIARAKQTLRWLEAA